MVVNDLSCDATPRSAKISGVLEKDTLEGRRCPEIRLVLSLSLAHSLCCRERVTKI